MVQLSEKKRAFLQRHLGIGVRGRDPGAPPAPVEPSRTPVTAEANDALERLTPDALVQVNLTQTDPDRLFDRDYMNALRDQEFKGEGDPKLKDLMRAIMRGIGGAQRADVMADLARIVGIPPTAEALDVDYGRFLVVRKQQKTIAVGKDDSAPDLDEDRHPEFMASRGQLMFGKVLGDAFGIHEVFASLLSPTGGLVGANNNFAPGFGTALHLDPDNPIALHGVVHDAAGYLNTFHDQGPGYNYLDSKLEILGPDSPFSGQVSGVLYWVKEAGEDYFKRRLRDAVLSVDRKLKDVRDAVAKGIDRLMGVFSGKTDKDPGSDPGSDAAGAAVAKAIHAAREQVAAVTAEADLPAKAKLGPGANEKAQDKFERTARFTGS